MSDLAESIRLPLEERSLRIRQELAVRLYQKGLLTFGKVRQLAEMSKWESAGGLRQDGRLIASCSSFKPRSSMWLITGCTSFSEGRREIRFKLRSSARVKGRAQRA